MFLSEPTARAFTEMNTVGLDCAVGRPTSWQVVNMLLSKKRKDRLLVHDIMNRLSRTSRGVGSGLIKV